MANTNNNKSLNVPNLRFKEFSEEWEKVKLNNFVSKITLKNKGNLISNVLCNSANLGLVPQSSYFDRDIANSENTDGYYVISPGDFVYNPRKSTTAPYGPVNIYTGVGKGIISPLYLCFKVNGINPTFLYHFFKSATWYPYMYSHGDSGARFDRVSIKDETFFALPFCIPSIKEQEKISYLLNLLDERIATQNKIIEKLQSLIKGLKQKLLNDKYNTITKIKLNEICEIKSGYSGNQVLYETPYKVSRIETISKHNIDMGRIGFVENIDDIYKLNYGDILFSNINSVQYIGNTAFIDKDYNLYHGMNLLRLIPNKTIVIPRYLHLLLSTDLLINHFQTICNKAVSQASINQTELGKTILYLPSISRQKYLCNIFISCENKLNIEQMILAYLRVQKSFLLQQLFI